MLLHSVESGINLFHRVSTLLFPTSCCLTIRRPPLSAWLSSNSACYLLYTNAQGQSDMFLLCIILLIGCILMHYSIHFINTYVEKEACPNDLAPTTSTTVQLVLGDALAICLLKLIVNKSQQTRKIKAKIV